MSSVLGPVTGGDYPPGTRVRFRPTTDEFVGVVVRRLDESEVDPEVGPMYQIAIQAFGDELTLETPEGVRTVSITVSSLDLEFSTPDLIGAVVRHLDDLYAIGGPRYHVAWDTPSTTDTPREFM